MPCSSSTPSVSDVRARLGRAAGSLALAWLALALGGAGCAALRAGPEDASSASPPEDSAGASTPQDALAGPSGSELWGAHCGRCHFNRSPSWYSDGQWDVAMFHMGVKAQLTRAERDAVLRYLKAANGP